MVINIKIDAEKIILSAFFAILLVIAPGNVFDHKIKHDFPYGYFASDAFQHQIRAEAIKDAGNFKYEAPYISKGLENIVARYPPVIYHLSVIFSYATGLEVYDAIYFIVFFFAIFSVFIFYLIIKDFNKNIALISLPLALLAFTHPTLIGFTWGHWPSLLGQFFLIAFFWCILKIDLEKSYILLAIITTALILTHTANLVFALIFLALYFGIGLISRNFKISEIKSLIIAFVLSFLITLDYFIIFKHTWVIAQPYTFFVQSVWEGNPGFYIKDFGLLLILIIAGIAFALFKLKGMHVALIAGFAMLIAGFMNYVGFEVRSFQIRFFWPIYLSVFFGFGIYMLLKLVIKKWNVIYTLIFVIISAILVMGVVKIPLVPHYNKSTSQGIMDQYHWSALKWLGQNAESNAKIYFFYGDIYNQDALLRNSKRFHYQVDPDDFINAIRERKIKKTYASELPGDTGGGLVFRKGLFDFEDATLTKPKEYHFGPQNICNFNYLIFDKVSQQQVFAQYNMLMASELLKKEYIKNVFENEAIVILKNNNVGADCIEERNF